MPEEMSQFLNTDCMEGMKIFPDNHFDLAIVDPPYVIGAANGQFGGRSSGPKANNIYGYRPNKAKSYFDILPDGQYFTQLFRISKNQIIWGANYYPQYLYHSGAIIWDKLTTGPLSDCEIAFQSFNKLVIKYTHVWSGFKKGAESGCTRWHPNQKPLQLYKWLLKNYAKEGDLILDTHVGSASSLIACEDMGFNYVGYEIDKDYYQSATKRLEQYRSQLKLFV